ncbi:hypothetical protein DU80_06320 [Methanosarcina mazei]|uniref:Uncharacterized protein n=1 Tax=Methanosarcina mazei TaxID=2209 RepID=A0A0F8TZH2_METMZ|nr:hypothetical protein DU40_01835 [Methanosarcina mazei]KKG04938.1 hypothetical protein DU47_05880 [Methanosarcina mazei]KKG09140.1 hypothetical protein DU31_03255 [Methanosarcina mazei]KKG12293.1 hypothetical protein DU34_07175 [Methanosarcina mazei]KKG26916.1 hypothetical protein DU52_02375 [Methanosarcina mazei]
MVFLFIHKTIYGCLKKEKLNIKLEVFSSLRSYFLCLLLQSPNFKLKAQLKYRFGYIYILYAFVCNIGLISNHYMGTSGIYYLLKEIF